MSELGTAIRTKLPRIIVNGIVLFAVWFAAVWISPLVNLALGNIIPGLQISTGIPVMLFFVAIFAWFAIKVVQDILGLADAIADTFVRFVPWVRHHKIADVKKGVKEIIVGAVLILLMPFVTPIIGFAPVIGAPLALAVLIVLVVAALALFWDAGKNLYAEIEAWADKLSGTIAGEEETLESARMTARPARRTARGRRRRR